MRSATHLETVIVQAIDEHGNCGWGEAPISRVTGTTTVAALEAVNRLATVVGDTAGPMDAADAVSRSGEGAAARMAVDCALHDLAAQQGRVPLARFLGGDDAVSVTTDMTISVDSPDRLAATAVEHVDAGFSCIKVKLDANGDQLERMTAVRDAVGPHVRLRVDANQAFSADDAVRVIRSFEEAGLDIEFVEQPVAADRLDELAFVSSRVETPVMADESVRTPADLEAVIALSAASLVNVKLAKTGGLLVARRMLATASNAGVGVIVGCMMESSVGIGAAAALAAGAGLDGPHDLDGGLWLTSSPVVGGAGYHAGRVVQARAPGLGITGLADSGST